MKQTSRTRTPARKRTPLTLIGDYLAVIARDSGTWVADHWFAVTLALLFILLNVTLRIVYTARGWDWASRPWRCTYIALFAHQWWTLPFSLVVVDAPWQIVCDAIMLVVCFGLAHRVLKTFRIVWIGLLSGAVAVFASLGVAFCANLFTYRWRALSHLSLSFGPVVFAVGPLFAATIFYTSDVSRRRTAVIGASIIACFILYRGEPRDDAFLIGALVGWVCGLLLAEKNHPHRSRFVTRSQVWQLMASISAIFAVGPMVAMSSPLHSGPFATLGILFSPMRVDYPHLKGCLERTEEQDCFREFHILRAHTPGEVLISVILMIALLIISWGLLEGRRAAVWCDIVINAGTVLLSFLFFIVIPRDQTSAWEKEQGMRKALLHASRMHGGHLRGAEHLVGKLRWNLLGNGSLLSFLKTSALPILMIILLLVTLHRFTITTQERRVAIGCTVIGGTLILLSALYVLTVLCMPGNFGPRANVHALLDSLLARFMPVGFLTRLRPDFVPKGTFARLITFWIGPIFWIVVCCVLVYWFVRSAEAAAPSRAKAGKIVELGGESMSFMATWTGNNYWFSRTGRSAIAYRPYMGVAITVAGPFGDTSEYKADLLHFAHYCADHAWSPAFFSVHQSTADFLVQHGWRCLDLGVEMSVNPATWKTSGKKMQDVRTAINRAKREGITDDLGTYETLPLDVRQQIREISEKWLGDRALPEMGFTLGGIRELADPRVLVLYAVDGAGHVQGATSWMPAYNKGVVVGRTLDFMRHRDDAMPGIMEFLIARMILREQEAVRAGTSHVRFVSLSGSPLNKMRKSPEGSNLLFHLIDLTGETLEPDYGFRSLYNFKCRFLPAEEHIFLCYPDSVRLPQIGMACLHAYMPDLTVGEALGLLRSQKK